MRRSFRRMSGRRPRPAKRLQPDDQDQKNEKAGFDNLGFNEPTGTGSTIPVYRRENSEMYELSANDQSVVTGQNAPYVKLDFKNQNQLHSDRGRETGGPPERPSRQVGRQGRGKQEDPPPTYNQAKYQSQQTGVPKQPRSPNDATGFPKQSLSTPSRNPNLDSQSVSLQAGDRSPTTENIRYDRYRDERSPSGPYGQSHQRPGGPARGDAPTAEPVPYDRYRDTGPTSPYDRNRDQNQHHALYDRRDSENTPYDWYRPRDSEPRSPPVRPTNTTAEKVQSDRNRGNDRSPSSPYGQRSPGWGGQDPRDRYNVDPATSYRGVNPADRYNMDDSVGPEHVVFTSNEHSREVSI